MMHGSASSVILPELHSFSVSTNLDRKSTRLNSSLFSLHDALPIYFLGVNIPSDRQEAFPIVPIYGFACVDVCAEFKEPIKVLINVLHLLNTSDDARIGLIRNTARVAFLQR